MTQRNCRFVAGCIGVLWLAPCGLTLAATASLGRVGPASTAAPADATTIDPAWAQHAYLKASSTDAFDAFNSVAVSGDTLVVGATGEDSAATGVNGDSTNNAANNSGAAYVFVRSGATWTQQAYLKAPTARAEAGFGSRVAVSGDTVVVTSPADGGWAGAAYVFVRSGATWTQQAYLTASNAEPYDEFGTSIAVSGDTVVIGARGEASAATGVNGDQTSNAARYAGAAYVFVRTAGTWTQQAYLKASNTGATDEFGYSIAVSGDTVAIGARGESSAATGVNGDQTNNDAFWAGAAYVFVRSGVTWSQQAYLKASNTDARDAFGFAVAASGDTVVVGADLESSAATGVNGDQANNATSSAGAAYVFVRSGVTWSQQAYLKASNAGESDTFGRTVALSGDAVVVGAPSEDSAATGVNGDQTSNAASESGAAYVFVRNGVTWTQQAYLKASNAEARDMFGSSVAVSGDTVIVGAYGESSAATGVNGNQAGNAAESAGAAYVFVSAMISVSPATLRFAATKNSVSGSFIGVTGAQTVSVLFSSGTPAWTVSADQPWLHLSRSGGTGSGVFTVSIINPGNVLAGSTSLSSTITVNSSTALNSPRTIGVILTIDQTNGSTVAAPFGQVDTPVQHASGVQGAIGVTGWALDNIGVAGVKIYRNCLTFENQANCQVVLGHTVVEVGNAAFLAGARTDVESAFSTYPQNHRAGWGYLMLTSMLPQVTAQQPYGGEGPLTLYAVATDMEGNKTLLGRSSDPASSEFAVPTQITMANASIAKPFGAIDTPAQGATVSGILNNFGWALTPDSNTTGGDVADILIPTNGSTMTVFIDSLPVAQVAYNQCRGNVGNPVPAATFCNDDVSNIFGAATPQPVLTPRLANNTLFRNLDAGRAAIGVYSFNTTTLSNGLHTIAWSVTDSAGRTEGIGSRFFHVLNPGPTSAVTGRGR